MVARLRARAVPSAPCINGSGGFRQSLLHFLHRSHFNLPDALSAHTVHGGQLVQRHAARAIVVHFQLALFHNAAAALVQTGQRIGNAVRRQHIALA